MDRREALKKLAAGTALTFASPLIVKSTAFADTGTISCQPSPFDNPVSVVGGNMGITAVAGAPGYVQLLVRNTTVAYGNIKCPTGYTRTDEFRWNVSGPGPGTASVLNGGGNNDITNDWSGQNRVRIVTAGGGDLLDAGVYTATVNFRAVCSNGVRTCWKCATFTATFTWNPATSTVSSGSSSGGATPNNCD